MAPWIDGFGWPVWVDDFWGSGLPDSNNWDVLNKGPDPNNREVQTYTSSTANVSLTGQGQLHITPQKDGNGNWTSGKLECKHKFSCPAGGKMILQAEIKTGVDPVFQQAGVWPAFWALGESFRNGTKWPQCGEWDILENSSGGGFTLASLHYGDGANPGEGSEHERSVGGNINGPEKASMVVENFNTYSLTIDRTPSNWEDQTLTWSLNGRPWFTAHGKDVGDESKWGTCAYQAYFPILNVAIGSNFPDSANNGQPNDQTTTGLGSGMQVLYVAFYKHYP